MGYSNMSTQISLIFIRWRKWCKILQKRKSSRRSAPNSVLNCSFDQSSPPRQLVLDLDCNEFHSRSKIFCLSFSIHRLMQCCAVQSPSHDILWTHYMVYTCLGSGALRSYTCSQAGRWSLSPLSLAPRNRTSTKSSKWTGLKRLRAHHSSSLSG